MTRPAPSWLFLLALLTGCGSAANAEQQAKLVEEIKAAAPDPDATRVEVAVLGASNAALSLDLPGELAGWRDANLAAANGGLVESVRVDEGDEVRKGQTLVVVDRSTRAAQFARSQAMLDKAKLDLSRQTKLGDMGVAAQLSAAETQVALAQADLDLARTMLSRAVVTAPFDGVIGAVGVEEGEVAGPGTPVVRLVQLDRLKATLSVSDRDVVALSSGLPARVRVPADGTSVNGTVTSVAPVADLQTRSFLVEVEVPNADRGLLPGMIVRVGVDRSLGDDAVVLPQHWLVTKLDGYGVFVDVDGFAQWRPVELGEVVGGQVVVRSGLSEGDRVVITGQNDLVDGDALIVAREGRCCTDGRAVF